VEAVGNDAAALDRIRQSDPDEGRAIDQGDWVRMTQAMIDAGKIASERLRRRAPTKVFDRVRPS